MTRMKKARSVLLSRLKPNGFVVSAQTGDVSAPRMMRYATDLASR